MRMPFGKFKAMDVVALPTDYLMWLTGLNLREPLQSAVWAEYRKRQNPIDTAKLLSPEVVAMGTKIIQIGYRRLAQECHPDHGGSNQTMALVNLAAEALRVRLSERR